MTENFSNNYSTALDGSITDSQTTLDVLSVGGVPSVNFRIKIENELMLVTGVASSTFTVTRGIEGTTAAAHSDGSLVTHVLTAAALKIVERKVLYIPFATGETGSLTVNVNTTGKLTTALFACYIDWSMAYWTHFALGVYGNSNAAGATITLGLRSESPGSGDLSATGNDLVISNTANWYESGWIAITKTGLSGLNRTVLTLQGSTSTVDLTYQHISAFLKYEP